MYEHYFLFNHPAHPLVRHMHAKDSWTATTAGQRDVIYMTCRGRSATCGVSELGIAASSA